MWTNRLTRKRACSAAVSLHLNETIAIAVSYIDKRYIVIWYVWLCCWLGGIGRPVSFNFPKRSLVGTRLAPLPTHSVRLNGLRKRAFLIYTKLPTR